MKYVPKSIKQEVNVSAANPVKTFVVLGVFFVVLVVIPYYSLSLVAEYVAMNLPHAAEEKIGEAIARQFSEASAYPQEEQRLQALLETLTPHLVDDPRDYRILVPELEGFNALALPGGLILVFKGLIEELRDERELAFVLAHELGHYHHRDHMRALSRVVVRLVFNMLLGGLDQSGQNLLGTTLEGMESKFSRDQESAADLFAVDLLFRHYGSVQGAVEAMIKFKQYQPEDKTMYYFSTHPHPDDRVERMQRYIQKQGYQLQSTSSAQ